MATIVIDPGHGGRDDLPGSRANRVVGARGTEEKMLTLDVGRRVAARLRGEGHTVLLTRNDDRNVSARERASRARERRADVFLSIHFNGSDHGTEQGTEVLVRPRGARDLGRLDERSRRLAEAVRAELVDELDLPDRGLTAGPWLVLDENLHDEDTARCISEVSYLTEPNEEARLGQVSYRERIAGALARGVGTALAVRPRAVSKSIRRSRLLSAPDWCQIRFGIIKSADEEQGFWLTPAGDLRKEGDPVVLEMLTKYWRDGAGDPNPEARAKDSAADAENSPWSAAFVSWVMRNAGVPSNAGFDFSSLHMTYIVGALRNRERGQRDRPFWFYGIDEIVPQPGDVLCKNRGGAIYTYDGLKKKYFDGGNDTVAPSGKSHSDVAIGYAERGDRRFLQVVGGNVSNTVGTTEYEVDEDGRLVDAAANNVFGVITLLECSDPSTAKAKHGNPNRRGRFGRATSGDLSRAERRPGSSTEGHRGHNNKRPPGFGAPMGLYELYAPQRRYGDTEDAGSDTSGTSPTAAPTPSWGVDTLTDVTGFLAGIIATPVPAMVAPGGSTVDFICRYLRVMKQAEADAIHKAGLTIVSICEHQPGQKAGEAPADYIARVRAFFNEAQGRADAKTAIAQASKVGQPTEAPIYFAVDYDDSRFYAGNFSNIDDYFKGVNDEMSKADTCYPIGVYGGGGVLTFCQGAGHATYFWQTNAAGWYANSAPWPGAHMRQFKQQSWTGVTNSAGATLLVDFDISDAANPGSW